MPVSALFENLEDGALVSEFVDWCPGVGLEQLAHAKERGIVLRQGAIISTGAVSQPFETRADSAEIVATYGGAELRMAIEQI